MARAPFLSAYRTNAGPAAATLPRGRFWRHIPITNKLAARFVAHPLDASIGYRLNGLSVNLGIGDLLVFSLFALAATREHGRRRPDRHRLLRGAPTTGTPQAELVAGQASRLPRPGGQAAPVLSSDGIDPEASGGRTPASTGSRRAFGGTRP